MSTHETWMKNGGRIFVSTIRGETKAFPYVGKKINYGKELYVDVHRLDRREVHPGVVEFANPDQAAIHRKAVAHFLGQGYKRV